MLRPLYDLCKQQFFYPSELTGLFLYRSWRYLEYFLHDELLSGALTSRKVQIKIHDEQNIKQLRRNG